MPRPLSEKRLVKQVPDRTRLVTGDLVALGLFVLVGEVSHGYDPFTWRTAGTAVPFLIGWFLAAPALGAYGERAMTVSGAAGVTAAAWFLADIVGQLLRSTDVFHGNGSLLFFTVTFVIGLFFLLPWRVAAARLGWGARRL